MILEVKFMQSNMAYFKFYAGVDDYVRSLFHIIGMFNPDIIRGSI